MYKETTIGIVVPCYNEENKIAKTITSVPGYVDTVYVIDDCSTDKSLEIVRNCMERDSRIKLVQHEVNRGKGRALATGYQAVLKGGEDIAVVMDGDGQMDPEDLPDLLEPIIADQADYVKGNRFFHKVGVAPVPRVRLIGNLGLSVLTKIASGYWHVSDTQCGYTAMRRDFLSFIDWDTLYPRYGCPNDVLTKLNIVNARVAEVPVKAVYGKGWASKMRAHKVFFPLLALLASLFFKRLYRKYIYLYGHVLIFCYFFSFLFFFLSALFLGVHLFSAESMGTSAVLGCIFLVSSVQMFVTSFWMDFEDNKHLCIRLTKKASAAGKNTMAYSVQE
ncbi:glycosyltransferase family 2 protein [Desulfovibrio sp. OttesenSCG-928-G15]|nr:glycosyltransferase family 2 protein [Desulfovibrio sp. OttesenSCG-928-G15]